MNQVSLHLVLDIPGMYVLGSLWGFGRDDSGTDAVTLYPFRYTGNLVPL